MLSVLLKLAFMTQIVPNLEIRRRTHFSWKLRTEKPFVKDHGLSPALQRHVPEAANWLDLCPATELTQEL